MQGYPRYRNTLKANKPSILDTQTQAVNANKKWPLWAKAMKKLSKPGEKGVGDTVKRVIGAENSDKFQRWHVETFGTDCGCPRRQENLNFKYPYVEPPHK